jgi:hypothetical protein
MAREIRFGRTACLICGCRRRLAARARRARQRRAWPRVRLRRRRRRLDIHDLRHIGNQFTADAGANPRELMARMGHDSPRAALIYMHSSDRRQRTLADAVAKAARAELAKSKKGKAAKPSGTRVARRQGDTSENKSR